ncbi:MAG TPA: PAS domain-containing sensor histidine kinase, partial [Kofleriaceae bacterium]|nr:PAS domain-containing sensor histidine kinase [Kofleriaceae bacterium]
IAHEQRYRNLAEAIPQIVWTASPDGAMTYFNRRWSEQTGQDLDAATGWGWLAVLHPDDAERCTKIWRDGVAAGSVFQLECRLRERDGHRWHLGRAVPELGPNGIVAWLGTFTDFDELHRAYDAAERAIHTRDEFLSIASHELRTPLTTLQLRLHSLKRDLLGAGQNSETERKLDATLRQGHRLMNLVDSLLDVSRITTGKITLHRETFDLIGAIRELVQRFTEVAALAGVVLELHADGVLEGSWDRLRVEQIAENLVTNALKYAPRKPLEITVNALPTGAKLIVRDRGPGIDEIDRERIFGAFERAVSPRNFGGLGLGLFIARQNAEAHGGTVTVESRRGDGTTFIVELPFESQIAP